MTNKTTPEAAAWQRMLSGRRLNLLNPSPVDIEIEDIAHGIARVARWNGQTLGEHIYSVAQHSVLVERIFRENNPKATADECLMCLLHDGAEYVVGDLITPFKAVMGDSFRHVEDRITQAIHIRFSLPALPPADLKKTIKKADHTCAYLEAIRLAGFPEKDAGQKILPARMNKPPYDIYDKNGVDYDVIPVPASDAYGMFMARFDEIQSRR